MLNKVKRRLKNKNKNSSDWETCEVKWLDSFLIDGAQVFVL